METQLVQLSGRKVVILLLGVTLLLIFSIFTILWVNSSNYLTDNITSVDPQLTSSDSLTRSTLFPSISSIPSTALIVSAVFLIVVAITILVIKLVVLRKPLPAVQQEEREKEASATLLWWLCLLFPCILIICGCFVFSRKSPAYKTIFDGKMKYVRKQGIKSKTGFDDPDKPCLTPLDKSSLENSKIIFRDNFTWMCDFMSHFYPGKNDTIVRITLKDKSTIETVCDGAKNFYKKGTFPSRGRYDILCVEEKSTYLMESTLMFAFSTYRIFDIDDYLNRINDISVLETNNVAIQHILDTVIGY